MYVRFSAPDVYKGVQKEMANRTLPLLVKVFIVGKRGKISIGIWKSSEWRKKGSRWPMVRVRKKDSRRKGENFVIIKRTNGYLGGRKPWEAGVDFRMYNKYLRV